MVTRTKPRIGDMVCFKLAPGEEPRLGQFRDVFLSDRMVLITEFGCDAHRIPVELMLCHDVINDTGPLGDGSISWEEWQELDGLAKDRLAWPMSSGK
jgi:hypothetical protein